VAAILAENGHKQDKQISTTTEKWDDKNGTSEGKMEGPDSLSLLRNRGMMMILMNYYPSYIQ